MVGADYFLNNCRRFADYFLSLQICGNKTNDMKVLSMSLRKVEGKLPQIRRLLSFYANLQNQNDQHTKSANLRQLNK